MKEILAHKSNFTPKRTREVDHIVIHYTAGDGDTAEHNAQYFAGLDRKASAHYFVDEKETVRSVREEDTAWHAGNFTMNSRSIGVELCSKKDENGDYYIPQETLKRGIELVKTLMETHKIPATRVIRHYDVTGKICPAPMVTNPQMWEDFLHALQEDKPSFWAEEACAWAVAEGIFQGNEEGAYHWKDPITREALALILYRMKTK
ncbi:MAG: N-acetylmuramoyl-L-alanine amidase [Oscillospiraceae bacterium]|nr:N-acetylmuramoyl-L-alanine amidase [Oscillospiraceae bacterium]